MTDFERLFKKYDDLTAEKNRKRECSPPWVFGWIVILVLLLVVSVSSCALT